MNEVPDQFEYRHAKDLFADCDVNGLLEALKHPDVRKSRLLRGAVIENLGDLADADAVPDLVEILKAGPEKGPRMHAAIALGKIEDSRGMPALRLALRDPERPVRVWLLTVLGGFGIEAVWRRSSRFWRMRTAGCGKKQLELLVRLAIIVRVPPCWNI
jgi:HEAT repeat protein